MKSYFTKFGAMLLCGVMFAVAGCHDYAEDIQQVNDKVDNLNSSVATEVEALEEAIAELDAKLATDAELKKAIDDLQASLSGSITEEVEAINAVIAKLGDTYATDAELSSAVSTINASIEGVKSAYAAADKALQDALEAKIAAKADASVVEALATLVDDNAAAIEKLEKDVEALEAAYKNADDLLKEDLTKAINDAKTELTTSIAGVSAKVDGLDAALKTANDAITVNANEISSLKSDLATAKEAIATNKEGVQANADALKPLVEANLITRLGEVETAQATLTSALTTEVAALKDADSKLKVSLDGQIAALTSRVETAEGLLETVQGDITKINNTINSLDATYATDVELATAVKNLKEAYERADKALQGQIEAINNAIEAAKIDINNLIKRVQSIVYVPEYKDGAARLNYATLGGKVLEGYSQLTYKVYPADYAKQIATVENATPFLAYDLTAELKSNNDGARLDIIKAVANDNGELVITVKPNLGSEFYTTGATRAAALVLSKPASEDNHVSDYYSTEYTNIVADKEGSKAIEMVLYKGDEAFDGKAEKFTWPFLATGDGWKVTLLEGLNARFEYNGSVYEAGKLNDLYGYVVEYDREISYDAYPDKYNMIKNIKIAEPASDDKYVTAQPVSHEEAKIVKHSHINNWVKATYTYTCSGQKLSAESTVALVEFPYTYVVSPDKDLTTAGISYIRDDKRVVLENKIRDYFVDEKGAEVEVETLVKKYPALVPAYGVNYKNTDDKVKALFDVENDQYPVTVSLAKGEDGKNLAKKEDVGTKLNVEYTFDFPVLNKKPYTVASSVEILKAQYVFDLGKYDTTWNWMDDHDEEAASEPYYREFVIVNPEQYVDEDVKYSEVAKSISKYVVTCGDATINDVVVTYAADKLTVSGFDWNKTYNVLATYDIITEGVVGAQVTVNFEFTTVGRPDELYVIDLGTQDVTYTVDQEFEGLSVGEIKTKVNELLPDVNRGTGFSLDKYLVDAISAGVVAKVNGNVAPENSGLVIAANGYDVTAKYNYNDGVALEFVNYEATMPCTLEFTAPYGQKFLVKKTLKFVVPTYAFGHDYYKLFEGKYAKAQGKFYPEDKLPITKFEVNQIQMLDIFNKLTDSQNNNVFDRIGKDLIVVFTPDEDAHKPLMDENVLTYNSKDEKIYVGAKLYIKNSNNVLVEAPTNFETAYKDFYVKKYDPIKSLNVTTKTVTLKDRRHYTVNLLELLTLVDYNDRVVIANGRLNTNNYAESFDFANYFGLELEYDINQAKENLHVDLKGHVEFKDVENNSTAPAHLQDLVLDFDYSSDIYLTEGFEIEIPVQYTNYWGVDKNKIVVKFELGY